MWHPRSHILLFYFIVYRLSSILSSIVPCRFASLLLLFSLMVYPVVWLWRLVWFWTKVPSASPQFDLVVARCCVCFVCCCADGLVTARNADPSGGRCGVRPEAIQTRQDRGVLLRGRRGQRGRLSRSSGHGGNTGCARALCLQK